MLRLNLGKREPEWVDLGHGVRLRCRPMSTLLMYAGRRSPLVTELGPEASNDELTMALARAVAREAVIEWEGVGDESGQPVEVTPEGLDALLDLVDIFDAFLLQYLQRGMVLEQEKNGSALSPSGTSAGAKPTVKRAARSARSAPTKSASRKRARAPKSGR